VNKTLTRRLRALKKTAPDIAAVAGAIVKKVAEKVKAEG